MGWESWRWTTTSWVMNSSWPCPQRNTSTWNICVLMWWVRTLANTSTPSRRAAGMPWCGTRPNSTWSCTSSSTKTSSAPFLTRRSLSRIFTSAALSAKRSWAVLVCTAPVWWSWWYAPTAYVPWTKSWSALQSTAPSCQQLDWASAKSPAARLWSLWRCVGGGCPSCPSWRRFWSLITNTPWMRFTGRSPNTWEGSGSRIWCQHGR